MHEAHSESATTTLADGWNLPASWTDGAIDVFEEVISESEHLEGAALAILFQACGLVSVADGLDAQAAKDGYMSLGSSKQPVVNPALIESRLARTAASAILKSLRPDAGALRSTKARRAARVRHGSPQGRR